ncbi:hypothetical protein ACI3L1_15715 [Deinococcus sp. SM5_A1]|uniref:hypothetical protein n=1 Tax=Deinococcus sp. SM5_A1 TaxID=3379094 RepID=UPI00385BD32B
MSEAKIVRAVIALLRAGRILEEVFGLSGGQAVVTATFDDGEEERVLPYYADELTFTEQEVVGLTREEVMDLFTKKDIAYLQS